MMQILHNQVQYSPWIKHNRDTKYITILQEHIYLDFTLPFMGNYVRTIPNVTNNKCRLSMPRVMIDD